MRTLSTRGDRRRPRNLNINGPAHLRKLMRADWLTAERRPGQRAVTGEAYDDPNWFKVGNHIWTRSSFTGSRFRPALSTHDRGVRRCEPSNVGLRRTWILGVGAAVFDG